MNTVDEEDEQFDEASFKDHGFNDGFDEEEYEVNAGDGPEDK